MDKMFKRIFRIVFCTVFFGYIILLFVESSYAGVLSAQRSSKVADVINDITDDFMPKGAEPIYPKTFTFTNTNDEYTVGSIIFISAVITPNTATYQSVIWSSSNETIASVSSTGKVTFLKEGVVTIKGKVLETSLECQKTFIVKGLTLESFKIIGVSNDTITIYVGDTYPFQIVATPQKFISDEYYWEVLDETIMTVNQSGAIGEVRALRVGETVLTVTHSSGVTQSALVKVVQRSHQQNPESFEIVNEIVNLSIGQTHFFETSFTPSNTANRLITIISDDESVVKTVGTNSIKGLKKGTTTITVYANANRDLFKVYTITVLDIIPTQITITNIDDTENMKQIVGRSLKLEIAFSSGSTCKELTFSSSDPSCVYVGADGTMIFLKVGQAIITITCGDGIQESVEITQTITVRKQGLKERIDSYQYLMRKIIGHFGAFLVLGLGAYGAFFMICKNRKIVFMCIILTGLFVASGTELVQLFVEGRYGSLKDVLINCLGYYIGVSILLIINMIYHKYVSYKKLC